MEKLQLFYVFILSLFCRNLSVTVATPQQGAARQVERNILKE